MNNKELLVAAIENGTVIDHIPSHKLFEVVRLLHLEQMHSPVTIGYNLQSAGMGQKSIIKIADRFFTDDELSQLAVVCPDATLCIIHNFEITEKRHIALPQRLEGIVRCTNPRCISRNEPMKSVFLSLADQQHLECHYCHTTIRIDEVKLEDIL